jgi:hypothetical protein
MNQAEIERDRVRAAADADASSWITTYAPKNGYLTEDCGHHGACVYAYRRFGPFGGLDDDGADLKSVYLRAFISTVETYLAAKASNIAGA